MKLRLDFIFQENRLYTSSIVFGHLTETSSSAVCFEWKKYKNLPKNTKKLGFSGFWAWYFWKHSPGNINISQVETPLGMISGEKINISK